MRSIENIHNNINAFEQKKRKRKFRDYTVAAVITLGFVIARITGYNNFIKPDIYFEHTQNITVKLTDGSIIALLKGLS